MPMIIDGDSLITVRAMVRSAIDEPVTSSTQVEMTVNDLLKAVGSPTQAAAQADFEGVDIAALKIELNAFLGKLRTAGVIAT